MSAPANCRCTAQETQCIYTFKGGLPVNPHSANYPSPADVYADMAGDAVYRARRCLHAAMKDPDTNAAFVVQAQRQIERAQAIADDAEVARALVATETEKRDRQWRHTHPGLHPRWARLLGRHLEASPAYKQLYEANSAMDGSAITFTTWCQCKAGHC